MYAQSKIEIHCVNDIVVGLFFYIVYIFIHVTL